VLWGGRVIDASDQDADTIGIRRLNERIGLDERVEVAMIPAFDGLTLARKR
jgi:caffeoyl-CoA O-methyltransferase